jgi:DNA-binding NarL/FixJ family response regulator
MTTSRTSVVVVDDHTRIRDLTSTALCGAGFQVVGVGATGAEAVALVKRHRPDLCLLDVHMPGNGIAAARSIASDAPGTVVVMLTVANDDESLFAALREGAQGYLLKGTDPDAMVAALRGVLNGEPALSPGLAMRILDELRGDTSRRVFVPDRGNVALTAREAEVLELLRQGLGTAAIGRQLFISPVTVRSHVAAVLKKLKADDRESALSLFESGR